MPASISPYLNKDDATPFLVALLPQAAYLGEDLVVDAAISQRVFYGIENNLFPLWKKDSKMFKPVKIKHKGFIQAANDGGMNAGHVGTGISCGVDSFAAIKMSLEKYEGAYKLDTLAFFNAGSHRSTGGLSKEESRKLFFDRMNNSEACARELGLDFLWVDSNLGEFLKTKYVQVHVFCNFSAVLACGRYFSKYYYASGYPLEEADVLKLDSDTSRYEIYLSQLLSTEEISFSISGENMTRIEKVEYISEMPTAQKYLNVCFMEKNNCGVCEKCVRTQLELYALGKLDSFSRVFDVEKFKADLSKHLKRAYRLSYSRVYQDIIFCIEDSQKSISVWYKIYGKLFALLHGLKHGH